MTAEGFEASGFLNSPPNGQCLNLPGAGEDNPQPAPLAQEPHRRLGDRLHRHRLRRRLLFPPAPHRLASERLKVRSVVFN
ncbi:hypothetical protein [Streptomyces rubiginosohelvolus]|uniref:hypothetical protein n=1 Tax=Streptomyces rubiginosohelvolus TaxID=67362 RepID=UPI003723D328